MYVYHMSCVPVSSDARRGVQILWDTTTRVCLVSTEGQKRESDPLELSYRRFQVAQYLQGTKSRSSARGASAPQLNHLSSP